MHDPALMRIWIVAAHPDDEAVGASALLGCRDPAVVVHVTRGAPREPRFWPAGITDREAYARVRDVEAARALSIVGADRLALGFEDLGLVDALDELVDALAGVLARGRPDVIVTHAYEGGHPDHDAVAFAIAEARARGAIRAPVFEMALYHGAAGALRAGAFLDATPGRTHVLDDAARARRRAMLRAYHSQRATLAAFAALDHERYRPAPAYDFTRPPHAGPLLYEQWGMPTTGPAWRARAARIAHRRRFGSPAALLGSRG